MIWLGRGEKEPVKNFCEQGNEPSDFINYREILEWLHNWCLHGVNYLVIRNDSV
jgi:hypothetical protein